MKTMLDGTDVALNLKRVGRPPKGVKRSSGSRKRKEKEKEKEGEDNGEMEVENAEKSNGKQSKKRNDTLLNETEGSEIVVDTS